MIEVVKRALANYLAVKIIIGIATFIPLLSLWYWGFDSSYLAGFGVGPEIYSRPVFASKLMLTWFVLGAIKHGLWLFPGIATLLFFVLFWTRYRAIKKSLKTEQEGTQKSEGKIFEIIDLIDKSFTPSVAVVVIPGLIILLTLGPQIFTSQQGKRLASLQLNAYIDENICPDTFTIEHTGCYSISGEPDSNYFVIANDGRAIIFLSRIENNNQIIVSVNVKDKATGIKIARELKRMDIPNIDDKKS